MFRTIREPQLPWIYVIPLLTVIMGSMTWARALTLLKLYVRQKQGRYLLCKLANNKILFQYQAAELTKCFHNLVRCGCIHRDSVNEVRNGCHGL
jgi:hypothetical protein